MNKFVQIGRWAWYPWLIALFPIIFLYATNYDRVLAEDAVVASLITLLAVGLLIGLLWLTVRNLHKAAAMSTPLIIAFFSYGSILVRVNTDETSFINQVPLLPVILVITLAIMGVIALRLPAAGLKKAAPALNLVMAALLVFNLVTMTAGIAQDTWEAQKVMEAHARTIELAAESRMPIVRNDAQHPDIYYIILDAYPSNESLMAESEIDNSAFTDALEERGFYVAYKSTSNYPRTLPSLASSLSMRYLVPEEGPHGREALLYVRQLIADSETAQKLQSLGYKYTFMLSGFDTASTIADLNIDVIRGERIDYPRGTLPRVDSYRLSMWPLLLERTMLANLDIENQLTLLYRSHPDPSSAPERVLQAFEVAPTIAVDPDATFAVIHIILPHGPLRFTKTGEILSAEQFQVARTRDNKKTAFVDQLGWLNTRVLQMVDEIEHNSTVPPIIIIQGDHGSLLGNHEPVKGVYFFRILNAYRFPGANKTVSLSQDIQPVNSFRVLFNTYFNQSYEMLEAGNYQTSGGDEMFDIVKADQMMP